MNYIEKALNLFNAGFATKADQKRCLELVNRAYDKEVKRVVHDGLLNLRNEGGMANDDYWNTLYWMLPMDVHNYRPKHSDAFRELFPEAVKTAEYLFELRNTVKSTPIVKVEKNTDLQEKVERIEKSLSEIFSYNMEQYERGLKLAELFGGLHVSVTPHYVHRDGQRFIRYFYYMEGKLTALNTILAVMQTLEDKKESTEK